MDKRRVVIFPSTISNIWCFICYLKKLIFLDLNILDLKFYLMEISPTEVVKLNVDAIVIDKFTTLVVVAQDEKGEVIFAWARQHVFCDLVQIEADDTRKNYNSLLVHDGSS